MMAKLILSEGYTFEGTIEEIKYFLENYDQKREFKIGDYVRVIFGTEDLPTGTIGKVTKVDKSDDGYPYFIESLDTSFYAWRGSEDIEKVEKEEAKWASIRRKPNEYKTGDIVMYTPSRATSCHGLLDYSGILTEIDHVEGFDVNLKKPQFVNNPYGTYSHVSELKLIVPVEYRFDLK